MLLGVQPRIVDIYASEMALLRVSQHNLRVDSKEMCSLPRVISDLRWEIQKWQALRRQWGSPYSGAQIEAKIKKLEEDLEKHSSLTVHPTASLPRGMIARIALRLLGGRAARYVSDVVCRHPACMQISKLAALKSEHTPSR